MQPANRLRALRVAAGLTQANLAEQVGVDIATISRWEDGKSGIADSRKAQLALIFRVTREHLMAWDSDGEGVAAA